MLDYLIVGQGIAGSVLAYFLKKQGKEVMVVDDRHPHSSSKVAAGIFNPITGKKLVKSWKVDDLFALVHTFYPSLEKELNANFYFPMEIVKPIQSIEEQNLFISKSGNPDWSGYVEVFFPEIEYASYLHTEQGGARLKQGGWVDAKALVEAFCNYFVSEKMYLETSFEYKDLMIDDDKVIWQAYTTKKVIFCEGHKVLQNPYFSWLPLRTTKGEQLIIQADLPEQKMINKGVFILPKGDQKFLVGATFDLTDVNEVTEKGKRQLIEKLEKLINVPYEIIAHFSGIRPTVVDRKPIIGNHPTYSQLAVFNGLGTKGISLSPYFAQQYVMHLQENTPLDKEVMIERYYKKFTD